MDHKGDEFLRRKFLHLYYSFDHEKKGFIERNDAELQSKKLVDILRRQLHRKGATDDEIEKRVKEFNEKWTPGAVNYFLEMSRFSKEGGPDKITMNDFISFNMSIRDHIQQTDALPSWFEQSLRMSYPKCWGTDDSGDLDEDGLELLPGVVNENRSMCHHQLTDNNNKKIGMSDFLALIKGYYSNNDPDHVSKYIHGYEEN